MRNSIKKIKKTALLSLILIAYIITACLVLDYPISGDSAIYAELTKSLYDNRNYMAGGVVHDVYPPLFPLLTIPFYAITQNPPLSVKLSSILFACIAVAMIFLLCLELRITAGYSAMIASLVALNPFFIYFTALIPYSEGLAIGLFYAGIWMWLRARGNTAYAISGLLFGLSLVTRMAFLALVAPVFIHDAYNAWKSAKKEGILWSRHLIRACTIAFPFALWLLRNYLVLGTPEPTGYTRFTIHFFKSFFLNLGTYSLVTIPIALLALSPIIYWALATGRVKKTKLKEAGPILFFSFALYLILICLASNDFWHFKIIKDGVFQPHTFITTAFALTRYVLPFLPMAAIISFFIIGKRWKPVFFATALGISAIAMLLFNIGPLQMALDSAVGTPSTHTYRSYLRAEGIAWINHNAPPNSRVLVLFEDPGDNKMVQVNTYISHYFRKDLIVATEGQAHDFDFTISDVKTVKGIEMFSKGSSSRITVYAVS